MNMIIGYETWVYHFEPETKQQSVAWMLPEDFPLIKFERS